MNRIETQKYKWNKNIVFEEYVFESLALKKIPIFPAWVCDLNASLSHIDPYLSACYPANGAQTRQAALGQLPLTPPTNRSEY